MTASDASLTQIVDPAFPVPSPAASGSAKRDVQRESLEQIVRLSIECTATEQRIEQEHTDALARENLQFERKVQGADQQRAQSLADLAARTKQRQESIEATCSAQQQAIETTHDTALAQFHRQKRETETALKKQLEEACWQAESTLVATEMKIDVEEQQWKKEEEKSAAEIASLKSLGTAAQAAMAAYGISPLPALPPQEPLEKPLRERLAADRLGVLAEYRQQSLALLKQLKTVTQIRATDGFIAWMLILLATGAGGTAGWMLSPEAHQQLPIAGGSAGGALVVGIVLWLLYRSRRRARVTAEAISVDEAFERSLRVAIEAAQIDSATAAAARQMRVKEARKKRDGEVLAAREKVRALQNQAADRNRVALAEETQRYTMELAAINEERRGNQEDAAHLLEQTTQQIEQDHAAAQGAAGAAHATALEQIERTYATESQALSARWEEGLRAVTELLAAGSGIDPRLVDWESPAWLDWKSPAQFSGQVRFGSMKVDLPQLTQHLPQRLQLPEAFTVPAMLALPEHASLFVEADPASRTAATHLAQVVMARLLTQMPAGRVKFTIFDPVGLGQSFAGFMHLADHDESLVGARIWTEKEHIHQRLADLTEHMETVIQKYLRNEYATIDEYNAQAGELAEPSRFLVVADFPTGFEQESLRRLASIALTGPRCGVYTLLLRDTRQSLPPGSRIEDVIASSVHLLCKNGEFLWDDAVFKRFPLTIDPPPDEKTLTRLMDLVGKAAKEAKRVEVPFQSIAPRDDQFWSLSSKNDLRVPIGKSGATRLQALRLGVGVAQHVLVAGKTGSGKSNLMHTIVTNLAMWYGPEEVEFYLVDFKKGVEFKAYATSQLPHARAIAVESDREFGLSVLQRVDAELSRRGTLFRDAGAQEISAFRDKTGQKLPRTVLLIDEFQEFFSEDDKVGQEASGLLDRLVRQGRAFGVHVVLGSQTIGGSSGLARSTLGQIAVRVALQCSEADSQLILGDNNSAARLLTRPGEAVYNDAGGLVEANSPFQIAFLPDEGREQYLEHVRQLGQARHVTAPAPIVFEGNSAAAIRANRPLMELLQRPAFPPAASAALGYVGEPVAIKEPSAIPFRRQIGANVLMVGQQEESALAIFASILASLAAQHPRGEAIFYLLDGTPADSRHFGLLERVLSTLPHASKIIALRQIPDAINELSKTLAERQSNDAHAGPSTFLLIFSLQRFRQLRRQEEDFSFSKSDEAAAPKTDKQFAEILSEGPGLGIHTLIWADTPITIERTLERSSMRQFDHRILFQMSASDSSNLIDSPLANRLGGHRALLYSEEQGTVEKFRPYQLPDEAWLQFLTDHLKNRAAAVI